MRRRLARIVRTGSPRVALAAARRELVSRRHEANVARGAREGQHLLVGPFLGEVGFELLYWIPVVRRLLAEHAVARDRVTVVARGGAASWYHDFAEHRIEILDLLSPDRYLSELVARRGREGNTKQFFPDQLDSRLAALAMERSGEAVVVHPLLMYSRLRFLLEGMVPPSQALTLADYRGLGWRDDTQLLPGLPDEYIAVKLYFSEPFPDDRQSREFAAGVLEAIAAERDVVVLTSGRQLDEHREWVPIGPRIHDCSALVTPQNNLAVQTAIVARARALVSTYGGFSYLGPMLRVPTLALYTQRVFSHVHLDVLRVAYPDADYTVIGADRLQSASEFIGRVREGGRR